MAGAYWNEHDQQWVADFRPVGGTGKQRRRVRLDYPKFKTKAQAQGFALECERYCRLLEADAQDPRDIDHAERIGALTAEQAANLRRFLPAGPAVRQPGPLTLREAAAMHPATKREEREDPKHALDYYKHLEAFGEWAGVTSIYDVKIDHVARWIDHMKREGRTWHARRHRLTYVRRACRMAQTQGLPDPISGLKLDRRPVDEPPVPTYTTAQLGRFLREESDGRRQLAILLGGFMGLRPSEIFRAQPEDLHRDILSVGVRKAKNRASRRALAVPPTIVAVWRQVAETVEPGKPILRSLHHDRGRRGFTASGFCEWLNERGKKPVQAKILRKSFATWAVRVLPGRDVERYMGHSSALLAQVTSAFYIGEAVAAELRPAARLIEREIRKALGSSYRQLLQSHKSSHRKAAG